MSAAFKKQPYMLACTSKPGDSPRKNGFHTETKKELNRDFT
jgi:hypothetical protein